MEDNYHMLRRRITRGCPQVSVLGPKLWNLVMDTPLMELTGMENTHPIVTWMTWRSSSLENPGPNWSAVGRLQ